MNSLEQAAKAIDELSDAGFDNLFGDSDAMAIIAKHLDAFARERPIDPNKFGTEAFKLYKTACDERATLAQENAQLKEQNSKLAEELHQQVKATAVAIGRNVKLLDELTTIQIGLATLQKANRELLKDKARLKWAMDYPDRFNRLVWEVFNVEGSGDSHVIEALDKAALAKGEKL